MNLVLVGLTSQEALAVSSALAGSALKRCERAQRLLELGFTGSMDVEFELANTLSIQAAKIVRIVMTEAQKA